MKLQDERQKSTEVTEKTNGLFSANFFPRENTRESGVCMRTLCVLGGLCGLN